MENNKLICKFCGSDSFSQGELNGYATLKPVDTFFSNGSPLIFILGQNCEEVTSIKVKKPRKFTSSI